jgi:ribosomal protein S18 acetylase RimI-like enzyme
MEYEVRNIRQGEWPLLEDFLHEAIFVPEGFEGEVPRSVIYDDPKCRAAFEGFGSRPDDRAVVAEVDGNVVGACWVRTTDEYGHIDNATPSFSISLFEEFRGQGIGTELMQRMLDDLLRAGYARVSLSVQKENPAVRLYARLGFRVVGNGADETEWLMVTDLTDNGIHTATPDDADAICNLIQQAIATSRRECHSPPTPKRSHTRMTAGRSRPISPGAGSACSRTGIASWA